MLNFIPEGTSFHTVVATPALLTLLQKKGLRRFVGWLIFGFERPTLKADGGEVGAREPLIPPSGGGGGGGGGGPNDEELGVGGAGGGGGGGGGV